MIQRGRLARKLLVLGLGFSSALMPNETNAQFFTFDVTDSMHSLVISDRSLVIQFDTTLAGVQSDQFVASHPCLDDTLAPEELMRGFWVYGLEQACGLIETQTDLLADPLVARVFPVYQSSEGGSTLPVMDLLYVSFEQSVSFDSSLGILQEFGLNFVDSVGSDHGVLIASVSDTESAGPLDYANALHVIPEVRWSQPIFCVDYIFGSLPNDPYFQHQYYLHNTGQFGGNQEVDIDIDSAWLFPLFDSLIVVAVIDDGVEAHPDLVATRILQGYDFVGPNASLNPPRQPDANPAPGPARYHGMACAGIIAAAHNNIGVAGIHGGCRVLPIKIADDFGRLIDGEKGGHEIVIR